MSTGRKKQTKPLPSDVIETIVKIWEVPVRLPPVSKWVEEYRYLSPPAQEVGQMRLERTPYFRELLDMAGRTDIERIVLCKSAQIAGTEFSLSVLGYYSYYEPCPAMIVLADEDTARYILKERVKPLFTASNKLKHLLRPSDIYGNELRLANGGVIYIGWASSVARLATKPIRIVILDEVDKPGYDRTSKEGDPITLAIQRTETFLGRKIIIMSTPTTKSGNIITELQNCDVIYDWYAKCPFCGTYQPLVWAPDRSFWFPDGVAPNGVPLGGVVWEGGSSATREQIEGSAGYKCGKCSAIWTGVQKNVAVRNGMLFPRGKVPKKFTSIGFCINRLYSSLGTSGDIPKIVQDWLRAQSDTRRLRGFVNNVLGEPYVYVKSKPSDERLIRLKDDRKSGEVPRDVLKLIAGIDVQDYGFYYVIRGFTYGLKSYLIRYGYVETWEQLDHIIFGSEYGGRKVSLAVIDSGGHRTMDVYSHCRRKRGLLIPAKGHGSLPYPFRVSRIDRYPNGEIIPGSISLYHIDTSYFKDALDSAISEKRFILHSEVSSEYITQLTSEVRDEEGIWKLTGRSQNHYLDCEVYALAGAVIMGLEYYRGDEEVGSGSQASAHSGSRIVRRVLRSSWLFK